MILDPCGRADVWIGDGTVFPSRELAADQSFFHPTREPCGLTCFPAPPKIKYARKVLSQFKRDSFAAQRKAAGLWRL